MIDFPHDLDVPMNPSSSEIFPEASMDHDPVGEGSIEVDMEEYGGDHPEYEMADGMEILVTGDIGESFDVEVFDVSRAHTPLPAFEQQSSLHLAGGVSIGSDLYHSAAEDMPKQSSHSTAPSAIEHSGDVPSEQPEHGVHDVPQSEPLPLQETSTNTQLNRVERTVSDVVGKSYPHLEASQSLSHNGALNVDSDRDGELHGKSSSGIADLPQVSEESNPGYEVLPTAVPVPLSDGDYTPLHSEVVADGDHNESLAQEGGHDPPNADLSPDHAERATHSAGNVSEDVGVSHLTAEKQGGEVDDTLKISEGVYIDPPPAVLLSVESSVEALFCLFNQPIAEVSSQSPPHESREGAVGSYHLLLEGSPTLYYEPISNVFDALRQDEEFLSSIPHSFEGELVFDAYDLQLTISEDNIHAREFSLHDLNVLYDGSDFAGPLRLRLTATIPRFIFRYYALQEQIQRLDLAVRAASDKQHNDQEDTKASDQQQSHDTQNHEEATIHPVDSTGESADEPPVAPEGTDGQQEGHLLSEGGAELFVPQSEEDVDHHAVPTNDAQVLEEEGDYENSNRGVEDATTEGILDADQIHESADTEATVSPVDFRFGGEQTNYEEYLLPEEYNEREEEDLDEAEGDSQFGDSTQYEVGEDAAGALDASAGVHEVGATTDDSDPGAVMPQALRRSSSSESSPEEPSNLEESQIPTSATDDKLPTETEEKHGNNETCHHSEKDPHENATSRSHSTPTERGHQPDLYLDDHDHKTGDYIGRLSDINSCQADGDEWGWVDADGEDDDEYWAEQDAVSDKSTATLSSQLSCKRGFDEVDEDLGHPPPSTPEPKRARVE